MRSEKRRIQIPKQGNSCAIVILSPVSDFNLIIVTFDFMNQIWFFYSKSIAISICQCDESQVFIVLQALYKSTL